MSGVRCGLGGLPPVVMTPFGLLGVGSNHHVEAASLAGEKAAFTRAGISARARTAYKARMHETHLSPQRCLGRW